MIIIDNFLQNPNLVREDGICNNKSIPKVEL